MRIQLNEIELRAILDEKFGVNCQYTIHYFEPEYIWKKSNNIGDIKSFPDAISLEKKYPKKQFVLDL